MATNDPDGDLLSSPGPLLTASEVAERLGVTLPTVYAYASRGALRRHVGPDGRTSRYDHQEVEELARRARPRSVRRRPGAVDVTIGTTISEITDGRIRYRGHDLVELVDGVPSATFEEVAWLLWTGERTAAPVWGDEKLRRRVRKVVRALPDDAPTTAVLAAGTAVLTGKTAATPEGFGSVVDGLVTAIEVHRGSAVASTAPLGSVATRLWRAWSPLAATPERVAALDRALVVLAEHELATSTLAARVAASTGADGASVVLAGLGALAGPRHGQAAVRVHRRLLSRRSQLGPSGQAADGARTSTPRQDRPDVEAGVEVGEEAIADGFGHPVHRHGDPRHELLLGAVEAIAADADRQAWKQDVAAARDRRWPAPNVDAALGALALVGGFPIGTTEALFAVARSSGWLAHAFEELDEAPLRFRGRSVYRGPR